MSVTLDIQTPGSCADDEPTGRIAACPTGIPWDQSHEEHGHCTAFRQGQHAKAPTSAEQRDKISEGLKKY